jgi:hypothetical protein
MIVILFMDGANKGFKPMMRDLENDYVLGTNKYPVTLSEALQVLMVYLEQPVYKKIMRHQSVETEEGGPGISFAQMKKIEMIKKGLFLVAERRETRLVNARRRRKRTRRLLKGQCMCKSNKFRGWHKCAQASCVMDACAKECVGGCIVLSQVPWSVE